MNPLLSKLKSLLASPVWSAVLLLALTLATYWPVATFDFVRWDDQINVYENPHLNPPTWESVARFWTSAQQETTQPNLPVYHVYRPVVYTAWAAVAYFAQLTAPMVSNEAETYLLNPHFFHGVNLVFHLFNSLLILALLRRISRSAVAAFFGASLFALHPVQVETVAWVTGFNDLLCTFFSLVAVWLYISFAGSEAGSLAKKLLLYTLALTCFVLALLSKPAAVVLPFMLFVIDTGFLRRTWKQSPRALLPWLVPAVAMIIVTRLAEPEASRIFSPLWARPLIALDALAFYLSKLLYPVWLGPDYGRTPRAILENGWAYLTWIGPAILLALAWLLRKRERWFLASVLVLIVGLFPILGLVPFRYQNHSTVADRYLYLAFFGVALFATYSLEAMKRSRLPMYTAGLLASAVLLLCAVLSSRQVAVWKNTATLFAHVRKVHPTSWVAHANYGVYLLHTGRYAEAARSFELALREDPDYFQLYTDFAYALAQQGKLEEAKAAYRRALQKRPDSASAIAGLGNVLDRQGHVAEAIALYRRVITQHPDSPEVLYNLGHALARQGEMGEAIEAYEKALALKADDAQAHNALALAFARTGESTRAASHWQTALRLEPAYAEAHVNMGVLRAQQGNISVAVSHWQAALSAEPENAEAHYYLGVVKAGEGKKNEAIRYFQEAIRLKPEYAAAKAALQELQRKR